MRQDTARRWAPLLVAALVLAVIGAVWGVLRLTDRAGTVAGGASAGDPAPLRLTGPPPPVGSTVDPRYHLAPGADLPDGPGTGQVLRPGQATGTAYPLVTARQAYRALVRTALPMPLMACPEPLPDDMDPVPCGGPITVTGASLDLVEQPSPDGPLRVPTWQFAVDGSPYPLERVAVVPRLVTYVDAPTGGTGSGGVGTVAPPGPPTTTGAGPASRFSAVMSVAGQRSLTVTFWGGVETCYSYDVEVTETPRQVRLTLVEHRDPGQRVCIDLAQEFTRTVPLQAPLGDRRVVDAETGDTLLDR